jgi:hypothetical protein
MVSQAEIEKYEQETGVLKQQIEKRTGKTTLQLYAEREKRIRDAVELRQPDRVPFSIHDDFPGYGKILNSAAYYDPITWRTTVRRVTTELEPDMGGAGIPNSGPALDILDARNRLWPGGPLPPNYEYQFVEGEYMKADEYDMFINDPGSFMIRRYLPRVYNALLPLAQLPPLDSLFMGFEGLTPLFANPEFLEMAQRLAKAGRAMQEFKEAIGNQSGELAELGFPPMMSLGGVGGAPFDTLSSSLRGMKGSMLDLYRQPENVLQACEIILRRRIALANPADPQKRGNPKMIGMPLWRGDKRFMSDAQFERFYWPGLKKALQATIDLGFVPMPFFEAEFGDRLAHLLELPKGKVVASIEYVDVAKASQILGGHTCLLVRVPPLSSRVWSPHEVESFIKEVFDQYAKKGGVLFHIRLPYSGSVADNQALLKSIREYTRY